MKLATILAVAFAAALTAAVLVLRPEPPLLPAAAPAPARPMAAVAGEPAVAGPAEPERAGIRAGSNLAATRDCEIVTHYVPAGDGTVTALYSCEKILPDERHPYEDYPDAALESLAYSDPRAAEILAYRWRYSREIEAISLIARAAALEDGDAEPIVNFTRAYLKPTTIDDVPVAKTVRVKYVLSAVTKLLGDDRHLLPYYDRLIRDHSPEPDREIARLDEIAQEIVAEMRQIQSGVSGTSGTGG